MLSNCRRIGKDSSLGWMVRMTFATTESYVVASLNCILPDTATHFHSAGAAMGQGRLSNTAQANLHSQPQPLAHCILMFKKWLPCPISRAQLHSHFASSFGVTATPVIWHNTLRHPTVLRRSTMSITKITYAAVLQPVLLFDHHIA